ncbi:MAG TPA: 16S rRNA (guanine(966)-N(2))-methyltransferase RsmD [Mycobacteriales bacterium]|nr:16S rRNA (guanine(966)-N(2))-methyltransferase RsmD [Mycobacteriales bacterium]
MRIVAGIARGRRLSVPEGSATRPTSDRAREAMFSTLESMRGPLHGARVLDLYAGTGAVGLEALSRGAAHVVLVEDDATTLEVLRDNVRAVGLAGAAVRGEPVERVLAESPDAPYDVVFADPPYTDTVDGVLEAALRWLAPSAVVVVERSSSDAPLVWPDGVVAVKDRRYGAATLWYGRAPAEPEAR